MIQHLILTGEYGRYFCHGVMIIITKLKIIIIQNPVVPIKTFSS
jgi:hypothetical protein